jgi:hypothetical protein
VQLCFFGENGKSFLGSFFISADFKSNNIGDLDYSIILSNSSMLCFPKSN